MVPQGSWGNDLRNVVMPWVCILNRLFWDIDVSMLLRKLSGLLRAARRLKILHIVRGQQGRVKGDVCQSRKLVLRGVMRGHIHHRVDVRLYRQLGQVGMSRRH